MKKFGLHLIAIVILLIGLPIPVLPSREGHAMKPKGSVVPASPSVVLGQPILVEVIIANDSPAVWTVDWGGSRNSNVTVSVSESTMQGEDRTRVFAKKPSSLDSISILSVGGPVALESGEQVHLALVLNSWFAFDEVGMYDVVIKMPMESEQSNIKDTLEVELEVEVRGPDPEVLAEACSELAETAIHGSMGSGLKAGEALSHVHDPVCIPALARVLSERSYVKNDAVIALAEMGTEQAISVLVAQWEDLTDGVKARAHYEFSIRDRLRQLEAALAAEGLLATDERDGDL